MVKIEAHPPKYCPNCGSENIEYVSLWSKSNWLADPKNPKWKPFSGIVFDTYCYDCKMCYDVEDSRDTEIYWFDECPEDLPEGGNEIYTEVLLRRAYDEAKERCGKCSHFHDDFIPAGKYFKMDIRCDEGYEIPRYYEECPFKPSRFKKGE